MTRPAGSDAEWRAVAPQESHFAMVPLPPPVGSSQSSPILSPAQPAAPYLLPACLPACLLGSSARRVSFLDSPPPATEDATSAARLSDSRTGTAGGLARADSLGWAETAGGTRGKMGSAASADAGGGPAPSHPELGSHACHDFLPSHVLQMRVCSLPSTAGDVTASVEKTGSRTQRRLERGRAGHLPRASLPGRARVCFRRERVSGAGTAGGGRR